jgi:hypothetical protein
MGREDRGMLVLLTLLVMVLPVLNFDVSFLMMLVMFNVGVDVKID